MKSSGLKIGLRAGLRCARVTGARLGLCSDIRANRAVFVLLCGIGQPHCVPKLSGNRGKSEGPEQHFFWTRAQVHIVNTRRRD